MNDHTKPGDAEPTATQRVYDAVYADLLEGRLNPGSRLREVELAARFEVSRTVVRQALQRLAQDGLVALQHNRGAQVVAPSRELATHVFDARRAVECDIARRLGGRIGAAELAGLHTLVSQEAEADARGDRPAAIRLSGQFHRTLARLSGNPVFLRVVDELLPTTSLLLALYQPAGWSGCVAHRHVELLAALECGGAAAAAEMRRHLLEIERSLAPRRDPFAGYRDAAAAREPAANVAAGDASGRPRAARHRG
jgi:DNA-binding GntR family transcriptional regulator